ncbi:MAG: hypothetical protein DWQ06_05325 [Calditrichaeota bacterium]|nr:MAG: hypothetical protein DWQ06_05325 [Calditrichota bacterium]
MLRLLFLSFLLTSCFQTDYKPFSKIQDDKIDESSGIIKSQKFENIFWTHNDSGDKARIFAIRKDGTFVKEVILENAENVDWEDIAFDNSGNIVIADIGNNRNARKDLTLYFLKEPDIFSTTGKKMTTEVSKKIQIVYPDQKEFPPLHKQKNFDCEAIFLAEGKLYFLSKNRGNRKTKLYRLPNFTDEVQILELLEEFETDSQVTAADYQNGELLVLCYEYLYLFRKEGEKFLTKNHEKVLVELDQCEAICFDGKEFLVTNEQRDIYLFKKDFLSKNESYLPKLPKTKIKSLDQKFSENFDFAKIKKFSLNPPKGEEVEFRVVKFANGLGINFRFDNNFWENAEKGFAYLMISSNGEKPVSLEEGQTVWQISKEDGKVFLKQIFTEVEPNIKPLVLTTKTTFKELSFLLKNSNLVGLSKTKKILLNVLFFAKEKETYWSVDSETYTYVNPFTWGECSFEN